MQHYVGEIKCELTASFVELKDERIKKKEYLETQEHLQNLINWIQG
jgi:hypothetical protein